MQQSRKSDKQIVAIKFIQEGYQEHEAWITLAEVFDQGRYAELEKYFPKLYDVKKITFNKNKVNQRIYVLIITEWIDSN